MNNLPLPQFSWNVEPDGTIRVQSTTVPTQVLLWQATNPTARDFRKDYNPSIVWTSSLLFDEGGQVYSGDPLMPNSGATAYFLEMTYPSGDLSNPYVFTTEIHVKTNLPLYPWPFASTLTAGVADSPALGAIASGLTALATSAPVAVAASAVSLPVPDDDPIVSSAAATSPPLVQSASTDDTATIDDSADVDAADLVFGSTLDEVLA